MDKLGRTPHDPSADFASLSWEASLSESANRRGFLAMFETVALRERRIRGYPNKEKRSKTEIPGLHRRRDV